MTWLLKPSPICPIRVAAPDDEGAEGEPVAAHDLDPVLVRAVGMAGATHVASLDDEILRHCRAVANLDAVGSVRVDLHPADPAAAPVERDRIDVAAIVDRDLHEVDVDGGVASPEPVHEDTRFPAG